MLLLNFSLNRFRIRLIKKNTKQERTETQMKLGEKQTLTVVKQVDFGVYLAEQPEDETRVLLPAKQVPEGTKLHDKLEVFLYKDSKDRLIATTNEPKLTLGGFAVLKVLQVTKIGAFLDWGLEKDLLLPFNVPGAGHCRRH